MLRYFWKAKLLILFTPDKLNWGRRCRKWKEKERERQAGRP